MNLEEQVLSGTIPAHIAVILDGNRRWAKQRNLPTKMGHREGALRVTDLVRNCADIGIKYLSVYAFSTENWRREKKEVDYLMNLLVEFVVKELDYLNKNDVKITMMGNMDDLPEKTRQEVKRSVELTKYNHTLHLNIALSYGSRFEIINAVKNIVKDYENNEIDIDEINEDSFKKYLFTHDMPDPDLLIRTSGEMRVSNFLLYQLAYTEFYFTDIMWPDFGKDELLKAILNYQARKRRFGN
ncbi:isoprenyl transferase [Sedimentibacter saalensis]|uniref:Isoprenyl transferase n=1 Tax=Sedimentibacter saalensis TaxID=130788 RepID=A0A562JGN0_9FIRM|nr:isoprenyl transferase [Sedimentibacter saalensis]MEA5094267.1 isoprenyl transferase [Sedimentibacter saalensis]TWH82327.1 undecaprenyl diphosphate synthase [Sedimentibacter saalensis]